MAFFDIENVRIDAISVCVPKQKRGSDYFSHLFSEKENFQFINATGVESSRLASDGKTTSDYCFAAAKSIIEDLEIDTKEIDLLLFVSQSPDYVIPMTSCLLQQRLGLKTSCIAFDVTSGCSGYVQGLSIVSSMLSNGNIKKALLLCGDVNPHQISNNDKTTYPLFGAAGSATLLSFDKGAKSMLFELGTDGSGSEAIMIKDGGARHPFSQSSLIEKEISQGVRRNDMQLILNGQEVFSFAISQVPDSVEKLYNHFELDINNTDYFVFHQANKMILETIADVLEIPIEKIPMSLKEFGNTSSASIPLTMLTQIKSIDSSTKLCLCGFGVGLSWGSVYFETDSIHFLPLLEI